MFPYLIYGIDGRCNIVFTSERMEIMHALTQKRHSSIHLQNNRKNKMKDLVYNVRKFCMNLYFRQKVEWKFSAVF